MAVETLLGRWHDLVGNKLFLIWILTLFVFNDDTRFFPDALSHLTNVASNVMG